MQATPEDSSRELSFAVPAYPSTGRIIFARTALFVVPELQRSFRTGIFDDEMVVVAELAFGRAAPRMIDRFQDSNEYASLLPVLPRLDFNVTAHR
jgi:hypothetical protein